MSRFTKPGLSHSPSIGGIGMCIDQVDAGAVLIGNGVDFDLTTLTAGTGVGIANGAGTITLSATGTYALPVASASVLGGIKVGANLSIDGSGVLSGAASYSLPIASPTSLGGIKVGDNLSIDGSGVLSAATSYVLPIASASVLGGIKVGSNLSIDGTGVLSGAAPYTLPIASSSVLGGIKVGSGLTIDGSGTLSSAAGTVTSVALTAPSEISVAGSPVTGSGTLALTWATEAANIVFAGPTTGVAATPGFRSLVAGDIPNLSAAKITTGLLATARGGTGVDSSAAGNGKLLIGTGSGLTLANLTAGANCNISNTSGGITIDFVGAGGGGALSPLTTKGDIWTFSSVDTRLGVSATDGYALVADSTQATGLNWALPGAMKMLYQTVVGVGGASSITFSSIPNSFSDLLLVIVGRITESTTDDYVHVQFNGDTGPNYSYEQLASSTSSPFWSRISQTSQTSARVADLNAATAPSNTPGVSRINIFRYADTNWYKCFVGQMFEKYGSTSHQSHVISGTWSSTSAISSITLTPDTSNFVEHTVATLYGIV